MKKTKRTLAIILCLVLILSSAVLADWVQYQKDGSHNGVIPSTEAPYIANGGTLSTGAHMGTIQLGSGGWSGIDSEALMLTESGTTYAYVTYNGGTVSGNNGGTRLAKINVTTMNGTAVNPTKVWDIQLTQSSGFQLSTPCYYNGNIYVAGSGLSQLLLNNELVRTYDELEGYTYDNWTISGGDGYNGYIRLTGNVSATFTSDLTTLTSGYNHRPALGIKLGTTSPSSATATVTAYAITSSNVSTTLGTYTFSPTASNSSYKPIYNSDDGNYYYYLNENVSSSINSGLTAGSYKIRYVVSMTNNTNNSVDVEYCSFYEQNSSVFEVSDITNATAPTYAAIAKIGTNGGQINTPITGYDYVVGSTTHKCIYFGTYSGTHSYYQYDLTTSTLKAFTPSSTTAGFYWAGAYSDGTYVVFGGDDGYLYCALAADFDGTGTKEYSLNTLGNITDAGNVRSSICRDGNYIYFTSQGGSGTSYIWKIYWPHIYSLDNPVSGDVSFIQLSGGSSTSTPVISDNDYIYVGTYGSSTYSNNGVRAIPVSNFSANAVINVSSGTGSGKTGTNRAVQSSVIVYSTSTDDYVYFTTNQHTTTNAQSGRGFCYKHTISGHACSEMWNSGDGNFALQGMSAANGYLTFGNDGHTFYVIKP